MPSGGVEPLAAATVNITKQLGVITTINEGVIYLGVNLNKCPSFGWEMHASHGLLSDPLLRRGWISLMRWTGMCDGQLLGRVKIREGSE